MATRIINRPSIKIEVKDGKYKPFIFDNGKKRYLSSSDEPEPPVPSVPTDRILYTVVEGGTQPTSTWITQNCSDNIFDAETGEGYIKLNDDITELVTEFEKNIFNDKGEDTNISTVVIPSQITTIGDNAFDSCTGLTSVTIPDSVTSMGKDAFTNCTGLTSVTIPNSVTSIGGGAFSYCTGLTSVTIPNSVTNIGGYAFYGCTSLTSVTSFATTPPTLGDKAFYNINTTTCGVPSASISAYEGSSWYKHPFTTFVAADV